MNLNPYQAPVVLAPTLADEQHSADVSSRRPLGVWILSGLHLSAGLLFLALLILFVWVVSNGRPPPRGVPMWIVTSIFGLVVLLSLATSIGLWTGSRWGWWLTAFYYTWAALGAIPEMLFLLWRFEWQVELIVPLLPQKLVLLAIHALVLLYLFKASVRSFCRVKSVRVPTALTVLGVIALVVIAATFGLSYSQSITEF